MVGKEREEVLPPDSQNFGLSFGLGRCGIGLVFKNSYLAEYLAGAEEGDDKLFAR